MSMKAQIFAALSALVDGRVFPAPAPERVDKPYITYQRAGGRPINYTDGAVPNLKNARVQINVWAVTSAVADPIAEQVEAALRGATALQTTVLSEVLDTYDEETKLRGTMQDFSFWT